MISFLSTACVVMLFYPEFVNLSKNTDWTVNKRASPYSSAFRKWTGTQSAILWKLHPSVCPSYATFLQHIIFKVCTVTDSQQIPHKISAEYLQNWHFTSRQLGFNLKPQQSLPGHYKIITSYVNNLYKQNKNGLSFCFLPYHPWLPSNKE